MTKNAHGFTIVEILIVIVVIGILASITIVAYNGVQDRASITRSLSDLSAIRKGLEIYKSTYGNYPITTDSEWFDSQAHPTDYVPGLAPDIISNLPTPQYNSGPASYMYRSDGTDYKIMAHGGKYYEFCERVRAIDPKMITTRDCWAYGFQTEGGYYY